MNKKILIAEDDEVSRRVLEHTLTGWGYEVVITRNGAEAWSALTSAGDIPKISILDWMMPEMDGAEICRRVRAMKQTAPLYIIMLTAKGSKADIINGLEAGANDYLTKPFDRAELRARLGVGEMVVEMQEALAERVKELEAALAKIKQLQEILPICSFCRRVRDDQDYWQSVETYISEHTDTKFSHGVCPHCYDSVYKPELEELQKLLKSHE